LKVPFGRNKKGAFEVLNITPMFPAGDFAAMLQNIKRGDWTGFQSQQPFFGWRKSPLVSLAADVITGEDYITHEKFQDAGDYATRVYKSVVPPLGGHEGARMFRSFTRNAEGELGLENARTGIRDTPSDFAAGLFGVRKMQIQPKKLFRAAGFQAREEIAAATRGANQILQTNAPPEMKAAVRRQLFEKKNEINANLAEKLRSAR